MYSSTSIKSCFIKHLLPAFGLMNMKAIDATQLQEFVNGFSGSSKSQITLVIGTLRAIFSTAYAEGYIDRDPSAALIRPKASRKEERRPLTPEETRNVLAVAENHPDGLIVAVLYYLGLRRGEALGLKWGDFDFEEDQVHIERDIDFAGPTAQEGELKTEAADRYVPIPPELKTMLLKVKGKPGEYVFHNDKGCPLSQATFKRKWCQLMLAADCADWREVPKGTNRSGDILKQIKPRLTPHFFRHNYVTLLYESGDDSRQWWVEAENVVGNLWLWKYHGDAAAADRAIACWDYIKTRLVDREGGEWFWSCAPDGTPNRTDDKAGFWKCPYHNSRMCLQALELL